MARNRKAVEKLVVDTMDALDRTGKNGKTYRDLFASMSDEKFWKHLEAMMKDPDGNFYLETMPWVNEPSLPDIQRAAKVVGVELDEYVYFPHQSVEGKPIRTIQKVPVGYLSIRRLQQVLAKKNSYTIESRSRSPITGQVSNESKVARNSDSENYALTAIGADNILKELHGPRADNMQAAADMYKDIASQGYAQLRSLRTTRSRQVTLNAFETYILGAGLKSDVLSDDEVFLSTKVALTKAMT